MLGLGKLILQMSDDSLVEVSMAKIKSIVNDPVLVERDEKGNLIRQKRKTNFGQIFDEFHYVYVDDAGKEIPKPKVNTFQVLEDGTEKPVKPSGRTTLIRFTPEARFPLNYVDVMLTEGLYELYTNKEEDQKKLYAEMERMIEKEVAYAVESFYFTNDSFKEYYGIVFPLKFEDGSFVFVLKTTRGRTKYEHSIKIEVEEKVKAETVKVLPKLADMLVN